jgi:hypothetical protein
LERALLEGEDSDELTIEEKIEEERAKLPTEGLTPVTYESLMAWKQRKAERKQKELEEKMKEEAKKVGGKGSNILSGRALFKYDPNLFQDDEAAADGDVYEERNEDEEEEKKEEEDANAADGDDKEERKEESDDGDDH